jgi:hypothetical protein
MSKEVREKWILKHCRIMRENGAIIMRVTAHATIKDLYLIEGWRTRPENQGEPRFQLTHAE